MAGQGRQWRRCRRAPAGQGLELAQLRQQTGEREIRMGLAEAQVEALRLSEAERDAEMRRLTAQNARPALGHVCR